MSEKSLLTGVANFIRPFNKKEPMRLCSSIFVVLFLSFLINGSFLTAQTAGVHETLPETFKETDHHDHDHDHDTHAGHDHSHDHDHGNDLSFVQNKGQWESPVQFRASLGGLNSIFLEKNGFTYLFHNEKDSEALYDHSNNSRDKVTTIRSHAYHVKFLNSKQSTFKPTKPRPEYNNYLIGNDQSKWASRVPLYDQVRYEDLYDGVHLDAYDVDGYFKYDFVVEPGASTQNIVLEYEGVDRLKLKKGDLIIHTSVDKIVELSLIHI